MLQLSLDIPEFEFHNFSKVFNLKTAGFKQGYVFSVTQLVFTGEPALHCPRGSYTLEKKRTSCFLLNLISDVCHAIEVDPRPQKLQGEPLLLNRRHQMMMEKLDINVNQF